MFLSLDGRGQLRVKKHGNIPMQGIYIDLTPFIPLS
jgi:hypothetical protein